MYENITDHLPEQKQQELQRAIGIIREEIDLDLLILFGSYARGDWVEDLNEAAFNLHPMVERLYGAILLVFTCYKPSTHNIEKLGQRVTQLKELTETLCKEKIERFC